jgi:hypothetical protein
MSLSTFLTSSYSRLVTARVRVFLRRFMCHHAHDMSSQQEESWQFLVSMPRIKCLVLDCLNISGINSHLGLHEVNTVFTEWGFIV